MRMKTFLDKGSLTHHLLRSWFFIRTNGSAIVWHPLAFFILTIQFIITHTIRKDLFAFALVHTMTRTAYTTIDHLTEFWVTTRKRTTLNGTCCGFNCFLQFESD